MLKKSPSLLTGSFRSGWGLATVGFVFAAIGCGSKVPHSEQPWNTVKVVVTSSGQPLATGQVTLMASNGGTGVDAGGDLDASGYATFPALPGSYVAVIQPLPLPPEALAADPHPAAAAAGERSIPKRYRSPATSPFAVEIREGEKNTFTFDLAP